MRSERTPLNNDEGSLAISHAPHKAAGREAYFINPVNLAYGQRTFWKTCICTPTTSKEKNETCEWPTICICKDLSFAFIASLISLTSPHLVVVQLIRA